MWSVRGRARSSAGPRSRSGNTKRRLRVGAATARVTPRGVALQRRTARTGDSMANSGVNAAAVRSATTAAEATPRAAAIDVTRFIRGTTLVYPVLGSPITQVKAPMLYNALFASAGVDAVVVPIEVAAADYPALLKGLFRGRNVPGAFVTIPHKPATVELLDDCSDAVRIAGACNADRPPRRRNPLRRALRRHRLRPRRRTHRLRRRPLALPRRRRRGGRCGDRCRAGGRRRRPRPPARHADRPRRAPSPRACSATSPAVTVEAGEARLDRLRSGGQRHAAGHGAHRSAADRHRPDRPRPC